MPAAHLRASWAIGWFCSLVILLCFSQIRALLLASNSTGSVTLTSSNLAVTVSNSDQSNGYAVGDTLSIAAGAFGSLNNTLTSDALTSSQIAGTSPTTQGSVQFDIDSSQQTKVILEILKYSGIIIRDPQIVQAAQQELIQEEANEKR